jgi:type IV pilus assembly protein PilQ
VRTTNFKIITTLVMGGAVTALATVSPVNAAEKGVQPSQAPSHLLAQTPPPPPPAPMVPNPPVTIDGAPAPAGSVYNPTLPRAIAPPVGDISISNLDAAIPQIQLDSNVRVNMVLKGTPAREVLESLARSANLNLAYSDGSGDAKAEGDGKGKGGEAKITLNLRNEPVQNAFNYVLQLSGLEANRVGNTIFVGPRLPDSVRETIVRTLRMNQVTSAAAANFLTTQGAETQIPFTNIQVQTVGEGAAARTIETRTPQIISLKAKEGNGPLLLKGLGVSTDERLNSITLVGSPRKVEMATAMLTRLDARRRQVALNIKIVDVNLSNTDSMSNSLSFKAGDGFLAVDNGAAVYNYGGYNPPSRSTVTSSVTTPPVAALNLPGGSEPFLDYQPNANLSNQASGDANGLGNIPRPGFGTEANPYQPGVTAFTPGVAGTPIQNAAGNIIGATAGTPAKYTYGIPKNIQYPTKFLSTLQAQIVSGNGKILTDPTLVVQEGQVSKVKLTQEVFGGFEINSTSTGSNLTSVRKPIIKEAGLVLDLLVNRIDDNGFVSVTVSPEVSSISGSIATGDGEITLTQQRKMNSGDIRLRDGQTLILSGIIQESDRTSVSKTPILGDIPILGALFRSTTKTNQRQEVVVLLTPNILDDHKSQINYTPGNDARLMLGK